MNINWALKHLTLAFVCISNVCIATDNTTTFTWPHDIKAAVSLSYDDAVDSHLDNAIPALNKHKLKGTFYLSLSSNTIAKRLEDWRSAAKRGHELGNHTLFHQCSRALPNRTWVQPHHDLDKISVAQIQQEILLANSFLHAIDGKKERTFTTPCTDIMAADGNYLSSIKSEFVAIKSSIGGIVPDMNTLDPYTVSVVTPSNVSGQLLIALVTAAAQKGTMVNITFHGIGGDHFSVSKEAHEELLQYLDDNRDIYWTDTFINIMKYVKKNQKL